MHALSSIRTLLFVALSGLLLFACRKDEQFTDEPGIELVFSADTVLFDTVFTTVGTITKRFTARNPSSNAVRVDIFLEGGTPSPYRINVDGASGTTFNDVEILGGDSIFVFVEATLGQSGANSPFVIEDHIRFNTNGTEQDVLLVAWGQNAHFFHPDRNIPGFPSFSIVAGSDENGMAICETVHWTNDLPYVIYGYAVVDSCSTLLIDPGVRVYVHGGGGLWVYRYGRILAEGTVEEPIIFQSDRLEPAYAELPGQWDRIWINEGPAGNDNRLVNVVIKNALIGVQCETFPLDPDQPTSEAKLVLNNAHIRNCSAAGILSRNYRIESNNLLVGDCGQYGVALTGGGEYFFNQFTIANYWSYEVRNTPAFFMTNAFQDINGTVQIRDITNSTIQNGIIHGANTNEFQLEFDQMLTPQLTFQRVMLRTDQNTSGALFPDPNNIYRNQDPSFRSAGDRDLHLNAGSFARNRSQSSTVAAFRDLDGVDRGSDGQYDLGCFEYVP